MEQQRQLVEQGYYHTTLTSKNEPGMYLKLFHGRADSNEELHDWGFDGGFIGPLQFAHMTYMTDLKLQTYCHKRREAGEQFYLLTHDDMLMFEGMYYGDWSVFMFDPSTEV